MTLDMPVVKTDDTNVIQTTDKTVDILFTCNDPYIIVFGNVLSMAECDELVAHMTPLLKRSTVIDNSSGDSTVNDHRTSKGGFLNRGQIELSARIEKRIAELVNWPVERGEGLQILSYDIGEEYQPHFDWFDPDIEGAAKHINHSGQRVGTFILYLNDVYGGGGTAFPEFGVEVKPKKGGAVFFYNTYADHTIDRRMLHAGSPVTKGTKMVATKWLREKNF